MKEHIMHINFKETLEDQHIILNKDPYSQDWEPGKAKFSFGGGGEWHPLEAQIF